MKNRLRIDNVVTICFECDTGTVELFFQQWKVEARKVKAGKIASV